MFDEPTGTAQSRRQHHRRHSPGGLRGRVDLANEDTTGKTVEVDRDPDRSARFGTDGALQHRRPQRSTPATPMRSRRPSRRRMPSAGSTRDRSVRMKDTITIAVSTRTCTSSIPRRTWRSGNEVVRLGAPATTRSLASVVPPSARRSLARPRHRRTSLVRAEATRLLGDGTRRRVHPGPGVLSCAR